MPGFNTAKKVTTAKSPAAPAKPAAKPAAAKPAPQRRVVPAPVVEQEAPSEVAVVMNYDAQTAGGKARYTNDQKDKSQMFHGSIYLTGEMFTALGEPAKLTVTLGSAE